VRLAVDSMAAAAGTRKRGGFAALFGF